MVMEVSAACHKNEGSREAMRHFVCWKMRENIKMGQGGEYSMKKKRNLLMCLGMIGMFTSSMILSVFGQQKVSAQLNTASADKITGSWADEKHIFSSFDDEKAFSVDASYGFKMHVTSQTKTIIEKGKKAAKLPEVEMPDFLKKYTWFQTSENTAGNIKIRKTNMEIYQCEADGSKGHWEKLDLVMTVTGIEKYKNQDGYIAIGSGINGCAYVGIEEMTLKSDFYKAGTNTPVTIKSNMTLKDIDTYQYIGIKADKIHGEYVSKNTKLSYKKSGETSLYYADFQDNYSSEDFTCVGFTFASDSFEYTFGRNLDKAPTKEEQYVGYGQNMIRFDPVDPKKEIIAEDGTITDHLSVKDMTKTWDYEVSQVIAGEIPQAHYFDRFAFEDQIESCLKIQDIKVYGDGEDVSSQFYISQNGNLVKAELKNPKDPEFYKKGVYKLKVKVKMNIPNDASKEQLDQLHKIWKEHGHYNSSETVLTEKNIAKTIIDKKITNTNEVRVDIELSKEDGDTPGLLIKKETKQYEYQAKDEITYKVIVKNQNEKANTAYFTIQDTSLTGIMDMKIQNVKVSGIDKEDYTLQTANNGFILKSKGDYALPYGQTIEITYTVKSGILTNGKIIDNMASAWAAGVPETKAARQVYINSPKNHVIKSAPVQLYKKGDHVTYHAVITNPNAGTFMRNVEIQDELQAEGMKIIPGTVAVISDGKDIASECKITFDPSGRSYKITTPLALKNGIIPAMNSEEGKKTGDYENLWLTDKIEITYQAVIEDDGLEGQEVKNVMYAAATKNSNGDLIREDKEIPSGSGKAEEMIKIKAPKLQITKQSDKKIYAVGETGYYKLHITQGKEGMTAQNVKVIDEFEKEGMKIQNIEVKLNEKDITAECKIDAKDHQFMIETGKDLGENDVMTVTYQVLFEKRIDGSVKNIVIAKSDNTEDDQDENVVVVKPPVLKIEKSSDHKSYKEGQSGKYQIRITQRNENMTAHHVIVEDHFEKEGMEISQIRVKYNGEDITNQCEIIRNENLRKFKIITGKNVSDKDELIIDYQVAFKNMITGDIKNIAESYGDDADKVRDDQIVEMETVNPVLMITKTVDKTTYKVGDICEYQVVVTQTIKDAIAKNVVIEDQLSRKGAKIIKNSIKVYAPDGSDITRQCKIVVGENRYVIETGKNLSYDESMKVSYEVKLKEQSLSGKTLKNTVFGKADFVKPVSAMRMIKIKKVSKTVPVIGKKTDHKNNSGYHKSPETSNASNAPKTGDLSDARWVVALILAFAGGISVYCKKKKKRP